MEPRPLADLTFNAHVPTVLLNNGIADEQAQAFADVARADGSIFGRKERLEDALACVEGDAGAVILNRNADGTDFGFRISDFGL